MRVTLLLNIPTLLQQKIHPVKWDSQQYKGGTTMVEITLMKAHYRWYKYIIHHGSTREVIVVLAVLSSTR
jgi:hypothetical protein